MTFTRSTAINPPYGSWTGASWPWGSVIHGPIALSLHHDSSRSPSEGIWPSGDHQNASLGDMPRFKLAKKILGRQGNSPTRDRIIGKNDMYEE